jgi:hypothetical protein
MKQMMFAAAGFERYGKTTRRSSFLAEMEHYYLRLSAAAMTASAVRSASPWDCQSGCASSSPAARCRTSVESHSLDSRLTGRRTNPPKLRAK